MGDKCIKLSQHITVCQLPLYMVIMSYLTVISHFNTPYESNTEKQLSPALRTSLRGDAQYLIAE